MDGGGGVGWLGGNLNSGAGGRYQATYLPTQQESESRPPCTA